MNYKLMIALLLVLTILAFGCKQKAPDGTDAPDTTKDSTTKVDTPTETPPPQIPDSLHGVDSVFAVAQSMTDPNKQVKAYRKLIADYPDSDRACDAQFMVGFIMAEKLKDTEGAQAAFKLVIEKYKDCTWIDDAKWMLDDLQGGDKTKEVMKLIEQNLQDSNKTQ